MGVSVAVVSFESWVRIHNSIVKERNGVTLSLIWVVVNLLRLSRSQVGELLRIVEASSALERSLRINLLALPVII